MNLIFFEENNKDKTDSETSVIKESLKKSKKGETEKESDEFGYMPPVYMFWALELIYCFFACWITLSAQYWIHYPNMTKRQVLQILKMKLIPLDRNPTYLDLD